MWNYFGLFRLVFLFSYLEDSARPRKGLLSQPLTLLNIAIVMRGNAGKVSWVDVNVVSPALPVVTESVGIMKIHSQTRAAATNSAFRSYGPR